jgi:hypothetical protein
MLPYLPLLLLGTVNFVTVSSFIVLNQLVCWINHDEAHEINTCIVFAFKNVLPHEV